MRNYELMYIISPERDEAGINALIDRVNGMIESLEGKIDNVNHNDPWGRRRLAYPIEGFEEGYYVLNHFSIDPTRLGELERILKLSDDVLRYLLTRRPNS